MPKQKYMPSYKVKSVLEALKYPDGISAYCRRQGLQEVLLYRWQSQMISNADALFTKTPKSAEAKIKQLESELKRKDQIIASLVEEILGFKKKFMI